MQDGPCEPWPVNRDCWNLPAGVTEETITRWSLVASQTLWRLSGRVWGPSCPVTIRPCRTRCNDGVGWFWGLAGPAGLFWGSPFVPYIGVDGLWRNQRGTCGCTDECSCTELCRIDLVGPVYDVVAVQDGTVLLPPAAYRVDNGYQLIRTDGACWNDCYDQVASCGTTGSLCVSYRTGYALDEAAIAAVSALAEHYIRGCTGCGCGIGSFDGATRVTRQGVTMERPEPDQLRDEGFTGLEFVDSWLSSVNPYRLTARPRVLSPDFRRPRAQTWP